MTSTKFNLPADADLDVDVTVSLPTRVFSGGVVARVLETHQPHAAVATVASVARAASFAGEAAVAPPPVVSSTTPSAVAVPPVQRAVTAPSAASLHTKKKENVPVQMAAASSAATPATASSAPTAVKRAVTGVPVVPFSKLLSGCCFSVSGFQNPERSDLRSKVLECGATYSHDWTAACTHLIAAPGFDKVDKFRSAVRDDRTIVTADWVNDTHKKRALQPLVVPTTAFRVAVGDAAARDPLLQRAPKPIVSAVAAADEESTVELSSGKAFSKKAKVAADQPDDVTEEL